MSKKTIQILTIVGLGIVIGSIASVLSFFRLLLFSIGMGFIVGAINYIISKN